MYHCPRCEKVYPLYQSLKRHWQSTHGKGYFCMECKIGFTGGKLWRLHIEREHFDKVLDGCFPNFRRIGVSSTDSQV